MTNTIQFWPGAEGIKAVYERSLEEKQVDFICLSENFSQVIGDYFDMEYAPRLYGKLKTREILPDTPDNHDFAKGKDGKLNQVRFTGTRRSETDFVAGDDWVALISYDPRNPLAVVIEEKELVQSLKNMYEGWWDGLK